MSSPGEPDPDPAEEHTQTAELVAYEDGDALIVCEKTNPNAWIRSTVTMPLDAPPASDRPDGAGASDSPRTRNRSDR